MYSKQMRISGAVFMIALALILRGLNIIDFSLSLNNPIGIAIIAFIVGFVLWVLSNNDIH